MTHSETESKLTRGTEPASLIAAVAVHERGLLERLSQAEQEAKGIVKRAREQAEALAADGSKHLAAEVREVRQAAAEACAGIESEVRSATDRELAMVRERARARFSEAIQDVMRMVLPAGREETIP